MTRSIVKIISAALCLLFLGAVSGCSVRFHKGNLGDLDRISELRGKVEQLEAAKALLEKRLSQQIKDKQVKLDITDRGLVITFLNEILFDSGKAELMAEASPVLDEVVGVIKEKVSDRHVGIEGHTDNQPIKHSGWESNWELSTSRAITVLHFLEDGGVNPKRLQATGFGEHRPVASNSTEKGRRQNRRVEIVILPEGIDKISYGEDVPSAPEPDVK
ncbi:MAG: OmpA family protein [Candidatus Omnitrophica bacterium]|nr:OmpA family protein [Candidatus Omnitrophota bacterium]